MGGLSESIRKENLSLEFFFKIMLNEVLKFVKNDICWKANVKQQEIKDLVFVSYKLL